ncbi:MAG: substrate-binding domain-containing protein [Geminicoccaceae bacterium]
MCSACRNVGSLLGLLALILLASLRPAAARELRVCADPNNLPFSNERQEGFENRIVALLARELNADVVYTWWAQRRGFIRNTLQAGLCDLVPGVPYAFDMLRTTDPYYRSTYVFVTRAGGPEISSFDDARLRDLRIGVELIGDDGANSPPVHALGHRGIVGKLRGFPVYGDYAAANPPARIVEAVSGGEVDVAVVWGPLAGYFARLQPVALRIEPVTPHVDLPMLPMIYEIAMGVRRGDDALRADLNAALAKNRAAIQAILAEYGVPQVDPAGALVR